MNNPRNGTVAERSLSRPTNTSYYIVDPASSNDSERQEVISRLKTVLADNKTEFAPSWTIPLISLERDSSLESSMVPGIELLKRMIKKDAFQRVLSRQRLSEDALFQVAETGRITALSANYTYDLTNRTKLDPELNDDLETLAQMAAALGGAVTLDDRVSLTQWLRFHEHAVPKTAKETQRLIALLALRLPKSPLLGNYWDMLSVANDSPVSLSDTQRRQISAVTHGYTQGRGKLLDHLSQVALGQQITTLNRSDADEHLQTLASHSIVASWVEGYIKELHWYGASSDEPISEVYRQQVMLTAVLMDLHPSIGEEEPRNHVAGFNLYATEHVEHSFAAVRTALERHLVANAGVSEQTAPLAAHLLLAGAAPEFLVKDVPLTLLLGTPQWVEFCRTVAMVEFNAPGSSRLMTYAQIRQLATIDWMDEALTTLNNVLAIDPLLDWALLNGIITLADVQNAHTAAIATATSAYEKHLGLLADVQTQLSTPFPTRRGIALRLLKVAAPDCDFVEDEILRKKSPHAPRPGFATSEPMSLVELLMANELGSREWNTADNSLYDIYPFINNETHRLKPEFDRLFNRVHTQFSEAMTSSFKLALATLPPLDRQRLLQGQVTLFTVRPSVAVIPQPDNTFTLNPFKLVTRTVIELTQLGYKENQADKDAATGRYGVVIGAYFENKLYCYELFTLHGVCRENPALAELIRHNDLLNQAPRTDFSGSAKRYGPPAAIFRLPTDIECYTHGVTPGIQPSSIGVIEKLAVLPATHSTRQTRSYYHSFYNGEFNELAAFIHKHRPLATYEELLKECWGQTRLERLRAEFDNVVDTVLNVIVPFKSCIQDILSDDPDRRTEGWVSCTVEAAMTLLLVVGAVVKIVGIAAKTASVAAKTASMARVGVGLLNSVFNPLDGIPSLVRKGVKVLKLKKLGTNVLDNATFQLRKLTGSAQSYDLIEAAKRADTGLGTWRPLATSTDSLIVLATRHNDQWYALNRVGQPIGPKLKNFRYLNALRLPGLHKVMPATYTRKLLQDALPVARKKVDDAIRVMTDVTSDHDSGVALKLLMGDHSTEGRRKFLTALQDVKKDLAKITPDNYELDTYIKTDSLAALNPVAYKEWRNASDTEASRKKFMRIYSDNFNWQYRKEGFTPTVPADDLIHEVFHGAPDTLDHAYALTPVSGRIGNHQRLDVKRLMNLASGHFRDDDLKLLDKTQAFDNADSFAVTTSLLSQASSNHLLFLENIATLKKETERARGGYIGWEVLLSFNPV
ncbi:hypothetical protein QF019_004286 [Pseudomonas frederiksbergensis]|uniref:hypothetical protein n=1 Tax=Pseudomonas frederiksbergensis TaxID=104087 RepID=UPI003D255498